MNSVESRRKRTSGATKRPRPETRLKQPTRSKTWLKRQSAQGRLRTHGGKSLEVDDSSSESALCGRKGRTMRIASSPSRSTYRLRQVAGLLCWLPLLAPVVSCGGDDSSGGGSGGSSQRPDETGAICEAAEECFPDVGEGDLQGEAQCLDRVRGGYCTHTCEHDSDCCAAEGECKTSLPQVCSPFESTGMKMCFLSCGASDVEAAGHEDDGEYCQKEASPDFICRSSGGGADNRKVCVPGDCGVGARCTTASDCSGDLECLTDLSGGYCTRSGCTSHDDCPGDGVCVVGAERTYCARPCSRPSDCSFCRSDAAPASCRSDVTLAEEGTSVSVCVSE